jgi:hypothetical protein
MKALAGRPGNVTDRQVRKVRAWKTLKEVAREAGLSYRAARLIREGYEFKQPLP